MVSLRIPGLIILFCAFALSFFVSVSLPFLPALDITRAHFGSVAPIGTTAVTEIRFGIWASCAYDSQNQRICSTTGSGYSVQLESPTNKQIVTIGSSWTRGLVVHPIATAIAFVAFLLTFAKGSALMLLSSLVAFFAAFMTLIAFAIDIALYAYVNNQLGNLPGVDAHTVTGPGFWLTFISLILLPVAGCTVCCGRRKDHGEDIPMSNFFSKKN